MSKAAYALTLVTIGLSCTERLRGGGSSGPTQTENLAAHTQVPRLELALSTGTLEQDPANPLHYWLHLPLGLQTVSLTPRTAPGTRVTIAGKLVAPNSSWTSPTLHPGNNEFEVVWVGPDATTAKYLLSAGGGWRTTHLTPANPLADGFGSDVQLSRNGSTLVVGAALEEDDSGYSDDAKSGAAYVFRRQQDKWEQQARLRAPMYLRDGNLGRIVSLAGDGLTLALSSALWSEGDDAQGNVYLFDDRVGSWRASGEVHTGADPDVGQIDLRLVQSVGLSGDGRVLVVGARQDSSPGEVYAFARDSVGLHQDAVIRGADHPGLVSRPMSEDGFGANVAISDDGNVLVASADAEVLPKGKSDSPRYNGAVYIFRKAKSKWASESHLTKPDRMTTNFGKGIALSRDGTTLAVIERGEYDPSAGPNSPHKDSGVYIFQHADGAWSEQAYIKAFDTADAKKPIFSLALSGNGSTLAFGCLFSQDALSDRGSNTVYVVHRENGAWLRGARLSGVSAGADDFGVSLAISGDGSIVAVGAPLDERSGPTITSGTGDGDRVSKGGVYVFDSAPY